MYKLASVCIDNPSREVDRLFDYIIPETFSDIQVGMRVVVPFGASNKLTQGIVMEIKQQDESSIKYKRVYDILEDYKILTDDLIELAYFMKYKYFCTLSEAVFALLPPFASFKEDIEVKLFNVKDIEGLNKKEKEFINNLPKEEFIKIDLTNCKLKRAELLRLKEKGVIDVKLEVKKAVREKYVDICFIKNFEIAQQILNDKKAKQQKNVMEFLLNADNEPTLVTELCNKIGCTKQVINSLVNKNAIEIVKKEIYREVGADVISYPKHKLSNIQQNAIEDILSAYKKGKNVSLIKGVTGSGKTEVYLNLVEEFIKKGEGAIVLVPEISLTPQTVDRFKGRFGNNVAILHSRLSDGERYDEWRRIKRGEAKVVVGARSAVFAPVENLKLIIIDEEHEYSYKSETNPKYITREVAEFRMHMLDGLVVLGSATPSIESYYLAVNGKYNLVVMNERIKGATIPQVTIVDMRQELISGNRMIFSRELFEAIKHNLENKKQTILFLNRRGYSTFVSCRQCGYVCKCSYCDVSMTYHISDNSLECHYCGKKETVPKLCPKCGSKYIKHFGVGTEKIEQEVKKWFSEARVIRMDMDTTRKKGEHERLYRMFKEHKADILIGTQMISKGMDFKNVTLVGVITADTMLNLPDFRSAERTFQLLVQVAGRAGRGEDKGRVIIQTYEPDHYAIELASTQNYDEFFRKEIELRKLLNNPPFVDILYLLFSSQNEEELIKTIKHIEVKLKSILPDTLTMLGPTPNLISKVKNTFRWNIIIKGNINNHVELIDKTIYDIIKSTSIKYSLDLNPYNLI